MPDCISELLWTLCIATVPSPSSELSVCLLHSFFSVGLLYVGYKVPALELINSLTDKTVLKIPTLSGEFSFHPNKYLTKAAKCTELIMGAVRLRD